MNTNELPQTLLEAVRHFSDLDVCREFIVELRWPNGVICPRCQGADPHFISTRKLWRCNACKKQFSVKVGTIFEDSPLGLDKWLAAVWLITNAKNGISSYEIHRALGVTQKSAWFLLHRVRLAMKTGTFEKFKGTVEADETFIGGKARFMHKSRRERVITGRGPVGKSIVMGILERHGEKGSQVKAKVVPNNRKGTVQGEVRANVEPGSEVFTDSLKSYSGLDPDYVHDTIDHAERYVNGKVHTNGMENFWSLLKRAIKGTYVSVMPWHLFRYVDEEAFRFNERIGNDASRFLDVLAGIVGRRVTYKELTGKVEA